VAVPAASFPARAASSLAGESWAGFPPVRTSGSAVPNEVQKKRASCFYSHADAANWYSEQESKNLMLQILLLFVAFLSA